MSVSLNTVRQEGGELYQSHAGESKDSVDNDQTYQLNHGANKPVNPDYVQDIGDGYTLMLVAGTPEQGGRLVIVDPNDQVWDVWGDPHVTWTDENGNLVNGFDFINNMTLEFANGDRLTLGTTQNTVNGMTLLDGVQVFDADTGVLTEYGLIGDPTRHQYAGQDALDIENGYNDGATIEINSGLHDVTFRHEDGTTANLNDIWQGGNDTTADFAKKKGVQNETINLAWQPFFEELGADVTSVEDRDAVSLGLLLLIVFQDRQDGIQDFLRVRLAELDGNNAEINKINTILDSVIGGIEGDGENKVDIPVEAFDFLVRTNTIDQNDPNISKHIEFDENANMYKIKGAVIKQALTSKAEELQNMSQQMQQQIQFSFSNLTNASETLTSTMKSFYDMIKSISRNAGG